MDFEIAGVTNPTEEDKKALEKIDFTKALESVAEDKKAPRRESDQWGGQNG